MDKVETVANNDKRKLLGELGLLEEVLDLLRVVVVAVTADTLNLVKLTHLGGSLNVLEVNIGVLRQVDNAAKVIEETLSSLVLLKQVNKTDRAKKLRVLGGNVHNRLQVLADVSLHHCIETVKRLLNGQLAEELGEPLGVEVGRAGDVNNDALDRFGVLVELKGLLGQTSLLAKVGNASLVEVGEHAVAQNSLGDLRGVHQVHLQETGLKAGVLGLVVLEGVEQESSSLLDHALRLEDVADTLKVNQRSLLAVGQSGSELSTLLGVGANDVLQQLDVIRLVAGLGSIRQDLVELTSLGETSNDLLGNIGLEVDRQGHVHIVRANHVTKLLGAVQLVLLEPLLQEVFSVLLQNWLCKFDRLVAVQSTLVEEHTEVLQGVGHLTRLGGQTLELLDGVSSTQEAARGVCGNLGSLSIVASVEELLELSGVQVIGTGETSARSELDGDFGVGRIIEEVRNNVSFVNGDKEDLTLAVDTHKTRGVVVSASSEDGLAGNSVHEDESSGLKVVKVNKAVLGNHEDDTILLRDLESDGEIVGGLGREEDVDSLLLEDWVRFGVVDLNNVNLGTSSSSHSETEELGILGSALEAQGAERSSVTLNGLTNATVLGVQLHGADDAALLL